MSVLNIVWLSLVEIIGDFGFERFANTGSQGGFIQGSLGYLGVVYFLIKSLTEGNVMFVNGMWDGVSGILESVAAYVLLGERLTSWVQYLGLALISFGLVFLRSGGTGR
jgi:multidrug transporter EmrE-like cation transporter